MIKRAQILEFFFRFTLILLIPTHFDMGELLLNRTMTRRSRISQEWKPCTLLNTPTIHEPFIYGRASRVVDQISKKKSIVRKTRARQIKTR
ncbi:unnamed protein product [Parnassius mnemosyne]|uniref:Secreted protein n=1 Tax=Parnassius mnemosyne TaxID=213953 RepID=A0AAV1M890_9NEOP